MDFIDRNKSIIVRDVIKSSQNKINAFLLTSNEMIR